MYLVVYFEYTVIQFEGIPDYVSLFSVVKLAHMLFFF